MRRRADGSTVPSSLESTVSGRAVAIGSAALLVAGVIALGVWMAPWRGHPPVGGIAAASAASAASPSPAPTSFRTIRWDDLMPTGWDPYQRFQDRKIDRVEDSDAQAEALLNEMRMAWDDAPTVAALDGAAVRIPGYLVPLDEEHGRLREFLLVPYFGACIHTPPPPANQIVHVRMKTPVTGWKAMDTVWVDGSMRLARQASYMGTSGYDLAADRVERYVVERR